MRFLFLSLVWLGLSLTAAERPQISGIYPHLAMFNDENECGTGAVVPWADRLWVITYGPHLPFGSSDKLYEITPELEQIIRPESVGGTPANRLIHQESQQLLIGPYVIDSQRRVRVIPPAKMPGRLTGTARHLTDPANKVYYATMEEGLYEVDVKSLEVTGWIQDGNSIKPGFSQESKPAKLASNLPGYHGKGLYSGQGRLVYANNGDRDPRVLTDPATPSGALAEWREPGQDWQLIRRNQFTEVTGPGGIEGNANLNDPIWSIGWDHRSLILMCLDGGRWHSFRLPKSSHSYDGAHGWNTEWPRIRDIGEEHLLMTMHGAFWQFPRRFSAASTAGLRPRSNYLKVIGDFTRWGDRLVFGCDDTARSEFLNKRKAKGNIAGPGRSQSNLWFVTPKKIDQLGPVIGRGAVWLQDEVTAETPSEPFLLTGYQHRSLHLKQEGGVALTVTLEVDRKGDGQWQSWRTVELPSNGYQWLSFAQEEEPIVWVRLRTHQAAPSLTALFHLRNEDPRGAEATEMFAGLAKPGERSVHGGLMHARGADFKTLRFIARNPDGDLGCYDLDGGLNLRKADDAAGAAWTMRNVAVPKQVLTVDAASVLYEDDKGRWRLPKGDVAFDQPGVLGDERVSREVCTERDLFNAAGTFFELPAENAGGLAKIRPVATHNRRVCDYASYRGLLVMSGLRDDAAGEHVVRSEDGRAALWVGAVDDLWQLGKPRGEGGPWKNSTVTAGVASDPYLMTGYDRKRLFLSSDKAAKIRMEADISGTGLWVTYREFETGAGEVLEHELPTDYGAYWVRFVCDRAAVVTARLRYD